jgi:TM2 domain-containing membrane protein YozV
MRLRKPFTANTTMVFIFFMIFSSFCNAVGEEITRILPEYKWDKALILAEQFIQFGCYDEAITEVKRFLFFHGGEKESVYAHNRIAELYVFLNDWEKALDHLTQSIRLNSDEYEKNMAKLERAKIILATGDVKLAEKELLFLLHSGTTETEKKQSAFFLAVCYIYNGQWDNAKDMLYQYFDTHTSFSDEQKADILALLHKAGKEREKSPLLASLLSALLPGSGQIYAGDILNGFHAFLINAGTGFLLAFTIIEGQYADAAMIFLFLLNRFYTGNIFHAERLARKYNMKKRKKYAEAILNKLAGKE